MNTKNMIFTFGSNTAGHHGAGAALAAYKFHGARHGIGFGLCGNSFAIPTKDRHIQSLTLRAVKEYVNAFLAFAEDRDDLQFQVTRIGCGLAGFTDEQIAPLFAGAPKNCHFDSAWEPYLKSAVSYWGTF